MKKLLLLFAALLPMVASAYDAKKDGIYYNFYGNEATVTFKDYEYNSYSGAVVIPASVTYNLCSGINTIYITDLSAWCNFYTNTTSSPIFSSYYHLYLNGEEISHLTIPENTTRLGNYVFYGCRYITSVTIPNSVMTIGESAFENCYNMETLRLPDELKIIKKATFRGCSSLKSVTIPGSMEFIYQEAFANCSG